MARAAQRLLRARRRRRFAQDLRCETLRPQLMALTDALAKPSAPNSQRRLTGRRSAERNATNETQPASASDRGRRAPHCRARKRRASRLPRKSSRLQANRERPSPSRLVPPASPQPAIPAERSETQPASQAAVDAERRVAQLESDNEALTASVSGFERDREALLRRRRPIPIPSPAAAPAERSDSEPGAALTSLPAGMPARVLIRYLTGQRGRSGASRETGGRAQVARSSRWRPAREPYRDPTGS